MNNINQRMMRIIGRSIGCDIIDQVLIELQRQSKRGLPCSFQAAYQAVLAESNQFTIRVNKSLPAKINTDEI